MMRAIPDNVDIHRRRLLRGDLRGNRLPMRPPWARPEPDFSQRCTRCDDCIRACEPGILFRGDGGFPEVRFDESGCDFCGDCLAACRTGALEAPVPAPSVAWPWRARIQPSCLSLRGIVCRSCGDACDTDAIRFRLQPGGRAEPEVDTENCNGCGECLAVCPEDAVSLERPQPLSPRDEENR